MLKNRLDRLSRASFDRLRMSGFGLIGSPLDQVRDAEILRLALNIAKTQWFDGIWNLIVSALAEQASLPVGRKLGS